MFISQFYVKAKPITLPYQMYCCMQPQSYVIVIIDITLYSHYQLFPSTEVFSDYFPICDYSLKEVIDMLHSLLCHVVTH